MFTVNASALEEIDLSRDGSVQIHYICKDVEFRLYYIADISERGEISLIEPYKKYQIAMSENYSEEWNQVAHTLNGYIQRDKIAPTIENKTDAKGMVNFEHIKKGMYLVTWNQHTYKNQLIIPQAFILSCPNVVNNAWNYEVKAETKYQTQDIKEYVSKRVHKIWDDTDKSKRPSSIQVQLLKNGEIQDTVTLSEKNQWSYQWDNLDGFQDWKIVEKSVPQGYTVQSRQEGITYILTNTQSGGTPPKTDTPTKQDTPGKNKRLPQTGMLWWPVPVLAFCGLLLFITGLQLHRRGKK